MANENKDCQIYKKHHNTIDGIYLFRQPRSWDDIPIIDDIDAEDEDGELYGLVQDVKIYDIEDIEGFVKPTDKHNIKETILIVRRDGKYYLCETQGDNYVKFSTDISKVDFIHIFDRVNKIQKIIEKKNG